MMSRRRAESGSADAVRMPGSLSHVCGYHRWGESHILSSRFPPYSSRPSLFLLLLLSLFLSLSMKKPESGKALCLSEKHILQEPPYECRQTGGRGRSAWGRKRSLELKSLETIWGRRGDLAVFWGLAVFQVHPRKQGHWAVFNNINISYSPALAK